MKMKGSAVFVLLLAAAVILQACAPTPAPPKTGGPSTEAAATSSGPVAVEGETLLDPAASHANSLAANAYLYEMLVRLENGIAVPVLALEGTVSEDRLDYILPLRPGVIFHDGTALNADAVMANFNRWFDPEDPLRGDGTYEAWALNFGGFKGETTADGKAKCNFDGIEKVNDLTVLIHLNAPDDQFMIKLTDPAFAIVSPAALAAAGFGTSAGVDGGSGSYTIRAWGAAGITLEPFADYWNQNAIPTDVIEVPLE